MRLKQIRFGDDGNFQITESLPGSSLRKDVLYYTQRYCGKLPDANRIRIENKMLREVNGVIRGNKIDWNKLEALMWDNAICGPYNSSKIIYDSLLRLGRISKKEGWGIYDNDNRKSYLGPIDYLTYYYFPEEADARDYRKQVHGKSSFPLRIEYKHKLRNN